VGLLERIGSPADLRRLSLDECSLLAAEIRTFLVSQVARTGGHLGPNLGAVELTMALHRVFDSPRDTLLWDTGHQAYVHKILTGRQAGFGSLRQSGGLSGYPSRDESEHDVIENSHASTALSYADGLAKAHQVNRVTNRAVVAVIGDGALTGGMAWEALNNIAAAKDRPVVIVVNDNERSYSETVGGLSDHLATLRTTRGYERFLEWGRDVLGRTPVLGAPLYETLHGMKKGLKDIVAPQGLFEDLGLKYIGPVDGHDLEALERALHRAKAFGGPVLVHALTRKGMGYGPAEADEADRFHGIGKIDPETGRPVGGGGTSWTSVFGDEMVSIGAERHDVVGVTAAMLHPVGLDRFARAYPDRIFDVGIAEQHAAAAAAGMAFGGVHPVVAVYATFLNRAFDQVLLDVALHRAGVTFVLDRAGVTGDDGASHNGMWDLSVFGIVPGMRIAAPRDEATLRAELREAVAVTDGPTIVRFPKGVVPSPIPAVSTIGGGDVLASTGDPDVLLLAIGSMAGLGLETADRLAAQGIGVTVVDPRWVIPVDPELIAAAAGYRLVVVVEDNIRTGGIGSRVADELRRSGTSTPALTFAVAPRFLRHAPRAELLAELGLTAQDVSRSVVEAIVTLADPDSVPDSGAGEQSLGQQIESGQ
jgi:1-deoxy-D-xylulose-5-phosphate synthase